MIGTLVGNYRVVERIGDGGMGTVYRARDEMLDREVALKVMRPELSRQPALGERFRQEAIALARLGHPGIAAVYGLERSGDDLVMVMEFVRGETLEAIVQRSGRLAWGRALELCAAVCDALDHAHDKGVVHRDIKPANLMLARDGAVKVMDFGIARLVGQSRQTRVGAAVGTPMYMSPEQLKGEDVDGRSDLYSLGAVCYELITGRLAFDADSDYELMMKQLNEPPPPVRAAIADVPAAVDELLQRAMAKRREDRFPDAVAMGAALRAAIATHGAAPVRRAPAETRLASTPTPPDREVQLPGSGITADHAVVRDAVAPTRLGPPAPMADRATPPPTRIAVSTAAPSRLADWRTWAGVAALALIATAGVRALRQPAPPHVPEPVVRDSGQVAPAPTPQPRDTGPSLAGGADAPPSAPAMPRYATSGDVARPVDIPGSDERAPVITRPIAGTPPAAPTSRPDPSTASPSPVAERVESVRPTAPEPAAREPELDAADAIAEAIDGFADAVNEGATNRVGPVLHADGDTEKAWLDLMKEGRLTMDVGGDPDVSVSGGSATARFSATLSVRSAFGANKRRTASFTADLTRSGSTWRVTAVRPAGRVELK